MLEDRSFIEQMKADILRRAEEVSDSEDDEGDASGAKDKGKAIAFEDELDEEGAIIRVQDGDSSEEDEGSDGEDSGGVGVSSNPGSSRDHMPRVRTLTCEFVDPSQPGDRPRARVHPGPKVVRA